MSLKEFAQTLPDFAKDIRLNVGSLLNETSLGDQRKYGLVLACAHASGSGRWSKRPKPKLPASCRPKPPMPRVPPPR